MALDLTGGIYDKIAQLPNLTGSELTALQRMQLVESIIKDLPDLTNAFTVTTEAITMVASGLPLTIDVETTVWMAPKQYLKVVGKTTERVAIIKIVSIESATQIVATVAWDDENSPAGTIIEADSPVVVTGAAVTGITPTAHAATHTDGTDDIQSATNAQKGLATAAHIQAIEANTAKVTCNAANVNAAGALMNTDFDALTMMLATSDNVPLPSTATQVRAFLNVADGAEVNVDTFGGTYTYYVDPEYGVDLEGVVGSMTKSYQTLAAATTAALAEGSGRTIVCLPGSAGILTLPAPFTNTLNVVLLPGSTAIIATTGASNTGVLNIFNNGNLYLTAGGSGAHTFNVYGNGIMPELNIADSVTATINLYSARITAFNQLATYAATTNVYGHTSITGTLTYAGAMVFLLKGAYLSINAIAPSGTLAFTGHGLVEEIYDDNTTSVATGTFYIKGDLDLYGDFNGIDLAGKAAEYATIWIPARQMVGRTTNGAEFLPAEYATNDVMMDMFLFDKATEEGVQFMYWMPDDWDAGTLKAKFCCDVGAFASPAETVCWGLVGRAISDDEPIDGPFGASTDTTDTVIAVGDMHLSAASSAITVDGGPAIGKPTLFELTRVVGSDTADDDAKLFGVKLQYKKSSSVVASW